MSNSEHEKYSFNGWSLFESFSQKKGLMVYTSFGQNAVTVDILCPILIDQNHWKCGQLSWGVERAGLRYLGNDLQVPAPSSHYCAARYYYVLVLIIWQTTRIVLLWFLEQVLTILVKRQLCTDPLRSSITLQLKPWIINHTVTDTTRKSQPACSLAIQWWPNNITATALDETEYTINIPKCLIKPVWCHFWTRCCSAAHQKDFHCNSI